MTDRNIIVARELVRMARELVAGSASGTDGIDKALELLEQGKDLPASMENTVVKELKDQGIEVTASAHGIRTASGEDPHGFFANAIEKLKRKSGGFLTKAVLVGAILLTMNATLCSAADIKDDIRDYGAKVENVEQTEKSKSDLYMRAYRLSESEAKDLFERGTGKYEINGRTYLVGVMKKPTTLPPVSAEHIGFKSADAKAFSQLGPGTHKIDSRKYPLAATGQDSENCYRVYEVLGK